MEVTSDMKVMAGILVATVAIIGGGAYLSASGGSSDGDAAPVANAERLVRDESPALGSPDARVTVVEFGDFQCPACGALHPLLREVKEKMADKPVRFVYRQFPLPQHEHAQLAAEASLAAREQGKFWDYHDLLFEHQSQLGRSDLERYAEQLGLVMDSFRAALDSRTYQDEVRRDIADGQAVGVQATPTLFINDARYSGTYSVDALVAAIDAALAR